MGFWRPTRNLALSEPLAEIFEKSMAAGRCRVAMHRDGERGLPDKEIFVKFGERVMLKLHWRPSRWARQKPRGREQWCWLGTAPRRKTSTMGSDVEKFPDDFEDGVEILADDDDEVDGVKGEMWKVAPATSMNRGTLGGMLPKEIGTVEAVRS